MNFKFASTCLAPVLLIASQMASAHDLPAKLSYAGKSLKSVASFTLTEAELLSIYEGKAQYFDFERWTEEQLADKSNHSKVKGDCADVSEAKTCGQIDDFFMAATVGMHTCNSLSVIHRANYPGHLLPRFTGPETFVSGLDAAPNHHDNYSASDGIAFECVFPLQVVTDVIGDIDVIDGEVDIDDGVAVDKEISVGKRR